MKNVLIIGTGADIVKTFYYVFKNNQVSNISFREIWADPERVDNFDTIILSGFHYEICKLSKSKLINYVKEYENFISELKKKCENFYLVSSDLSINKSISKVVFFYYNLINNISLDKEIKILSFHTIVGHDEGIKNKIKISTLRILNIETMHFKKMVEIISDQKNNKINFIKFYFIDFPRPRSIDRILRLIVDLFIFKIL